ncbi:MAG: FkbM family methyltransferase [Saprospiraceae bacterium]
MTKDELLANLDRVGRMASASKAGRMLANPLKYLEATLFRELIYRRLKRPRQVVGQTFFGSKMRLLLPSGTDIYLTGGKSHDSELRLARFLIQYLKPGDCFVDVGAHYGYFSLLAAAIVGRSGSVHAFEASPTTFEVLRHNTRPFGQIAIRRKAVSDTNAQVSFFEFPNLYSEYNTTSVEQFRDAAWYADSGPVQVVVDSVALDDFLREAQAHPTVIKIDVEGGEYRVICGLQRYLSTYSPMVAMEYLSVHRGNEAHVRAAELMAELGFSPSAIDASGKLCRIDDPARFLSNRGLDSDNIVFAKI